MSGETTITIIGNLVADPELRFTPSGAAVANFTIASTPRTFDKTRNEWVDGEALFLRCSIWRDAAEHVAESLTRGTRVIATGRLRSRSWEDKQTSQKRTSIELDVDEIGPSLRYTSGKVSRGAHGAGSQSRTAPSGGSPVSVDPWASNAPQNGSQGGGWGRSSGLSSYDEPPFVCPATSYGQWEGALA